ncbi:MAG: DUF4830 domain-containing protein [Ruminococcaceae bacterium]|nr:DUF4830 domain-containing protein [Oscillospiraceae bacterium]
MFVYSLKADRLKAFLTLALAFTVLVGLILAVPAYGAVETTSGDISYTDVKSGADAANFLRQFGWDVSDEPNESTEVRIPAQFDEVFTQYNDIQKKQGLDLSKYRRKTVTRYTFEVKNFPEATGTVIASVITYRNRVIAGDLYKIGNGGFVVGLDGK